MLSFPHFLALHFPLLLLLRLEHKCTNTGDVSVGVPYSGPPPTIHRPRTRPFSPYSTNLPPQPRPPSYLFPFIYMLSLPPRFTVQPARTPDAPEPSLPDDSCLD
ncbi:hypothetical protein PTI98_005107 [Pleurotus ostreatus]|nr:hypothetical protein PTI98_005107 [Pleurotus ostreatus]